MTECNIDDFSQEEKDICDTANLLIEGAKKEYDSAKNEKDRINLNGILTQFDMEFHSAFKDEDVGITAKMLCSALGELDRKIDNIERETNKINDLAKTTDLAGLGGKVDSVKSETDKIRSLAKITDFSSLAEKDDLKNLAKKNDLNNLSQQITNFAKQDEAFDQTITQEIKTISQRMNIIPEEAKVELVKGNEITDKYEAEIKLADSNNKIGIFSPEGYYFYDDKIYIYDQFEPKTNVDLPAHYHFLKVVKTEEDGYKLAFCNSNGQEYYNILNDYRLISPVDVKSIENINLEKYYAKNGSDPSFIAKASNNTYPSSGKHSVDIYEINNEGEKIGSLIDEFGYYDSQNRFHYFNNHMDAGDHSYNSPLFTINEGNNKCHLHKMQENGQDIYLTKNTITCSLVEYVANYVNNEYFYH